MLFPFQMELLHYQEESPEQPQVKMTPHYWLTCNSPEKTRSKPVLNLLKALGWMLEVENLLKTNQEVKKIWLSGFPGCKLFTCYALYVSHLFISHIALCMSLAIFVFLFYMTLACMQPNCTRDGGFLQVNILNRWHEVSHINRDFIAIQSVS